MMTARVECKMLDDEKKNPGLLCCRVYNVYSTVFWKDSQRLQKIKHCCMSDIYKGECGCSSALLMFLWTDKTKFAQGIQKYISSDVCWRLFPKNDQVTTSKSSLFSVKFSEDMKTLVSFRFNVQFMQMKPSKSNKFTFFMFPATVNIQT